jgi:hypothetical protein
MCIHPQYQKWVYYVEVIKIHHVYSSPISEMSMYWPWKNWSIMIGWPTLHAILSLVVLDLKGRKKTSEVEEMLLLDTSCWTNYWVQYIYIEIRMIMVMACRNQFLTCLHQSHKSTYLERGHVQSCDSWLDSAMDCQTEIRNTGIAQ